MAKELQWIVSGGGPLLLLEERLLRSWRGSDVQLSGSGGSDYDRACAAGPLGLIAVGDGQGLVVGGEVLETAWWPEPQTGSGILVRWVYADSDEGVQEALLNMADSMFSAVDALALFQSSRLRLFDSAMLGRDILTPSLSITVRKGRHKLQTARFQPDSRTELVLHRLRPA